MGYITAILNRLGNNSAPTLHKMMKTILKEKQDSYKYSSRRIIGSDFNDLSNSPVALNYFYSENETQDFLKHTHKMNHRLAFEGKLFTNESSQNSINVKKLIEFPEKNIKRLIEEQMGSYAIIVCDEAALYCGRDPIGVVPLYYGENKNLVALASRMKPIWSIGLNAKPIPPGCYASIDKEGISLQRVKTLKQPMRKKTELKKTVKKLDSYITKAVEVRCEGLNRVALGFSGGIDSSILAHYLASIGLKVELICVGMSESKWFDVAQSSADYLGLPLQIEKYNNKDLEKDLDAVLWSVEKANPIQVSIAFPLFWASRKATISGNAVFFSGSGSGYHRYVKEYISNGEKVRETMFQDVKNSYIFNYERDYKICMDQGIQLMLPYADLNLIQFSLSLPTEYLLSEVIGAPRKIILRKLAKNIGFPPEMAYLPKKALQYSTGVNKALRKLAKIYDKRLSDYLSERFERLKSERL
jgi:asparagine synthase (glutamine-hydrolysing)